MRVGGRLRDWGLLVVKLLWLESFLGVDLSIGILIELIALVNLIVNCMVILHLWHILNRMENLLLLKLTLRDHIISIFLAEILRYLLRRLIINIPRILVHGMIMLKSGIHLV
jgi:hypothetical protein